MITEEEFIHQLDCSIENHKSCISLLQDKKIEILNRIKEREENEIRSM